MTVMATPRLTCPCVESVFPTFPFITTATLSVSGKTGKLTPPVPTLSERYTKRRGQEVSEAPIDRIAAPVAPSAREMERKGVAPIDSSPEKVAMACVCK